MATPTRPCPYCGQQVLMAAAHCGYCGRPLPQAPAGAQPPAPPPGGLSPPPPGGRPAYQPPSGPAPQKTLFGVSAPLPHGGAPAGGLPPRAPSAAPPQPAPPQQPQFTPPAPPPQPQHQAPPQQPWQPPPAAPPPQQPWQQAPAAASPPPPQAPWQPPSPPQPQFTPPAPPPQPPPPAQAPWQQPPAPQVAPMPQPAWQQPPQQQPQFQGAMVAARPGPQGAFLGLLRDQQFESKVMLGAAAALFVSRFIPVGKFGDSMQWTWSGPGSMVFRIMVWALIAALVYGATALAPPQTRAQLPAGLFSWATFLIAYIGAGLTYTAAPFGERLDGLALFAWVYPLFLAGLCARLQDPTDNIGRSLIGVGGLLSFIGGMIESKFIWHFEHVPGLLILHNILFFVILLLTLVAIVLSIPAKLVPGLEKLDAFAKPLTAVLVAWVPLSLFLLTFASWVSEGGKFVNFLFGFPHAMVFAIGYVGIALLAAPEAFDTLRKFVNAAGQAQAGQVYSPPPGIAGGPFPDSTPPPPLTVDQKLAELDAAWGRGGMSPEEYHQRRAAIMAGH